MPAYHRKILCDLIQRFSPNGTGVEIGINRGKTSDSILTDTSTKHLYMIDPWMSNFDTTRGLYSTKCNTEDDCNYVTERFAVNFPKQHTIIRKQSNDAINDVPDNLDFIFIDGNHTYDYVMNDLNFWASKLKSGGLFSGHDWWNKFPGVIKAVTEFFTSNEDFSPPNHDIDGHIPAPSQKPVVMKSWPLGHVWWTIKK